MEKCPRVGAQACGGTFLSLPDMKTIVITGTSRGIGLELALLFASDGYRVIALSRNLHPEIAAHPNIIFFQTDLSLADGLSAFSEFLSSEQIHIDALIHNAGLLVSKPFGQLRTEDFERVYRVNVFGLAELTRLSLPYIKAGGHVVSISSMGGIQGSAKFPGLAAYSSSKGAVITLTELLAEEYKDSGVSFNVLALGAVQTEMLAEAFPGYKAGVSAADMASYIKDFALTGQKFYNGKALQVSFSTP